MSEHEARGAETTEFDDGESEDDAAQAQAQAPAPAAPVMQAFHSLNLEEMLPWMIVGIALPLFPHLIYGLACILWRALWSLVWLIISVWVPMSAIGLLIGVMIQ
tara:strand:- start:824 stop:1135 length:312 start_codon:yes stop_codon:yes gene_type:complete